MNGIVNSIDTFAVNHFISTDRLPSPCQQLSGCSSDINSLHDISSDHISHPHHVLWPVTRQFRDGRPDLMSFDDGAPETGAVV